MEHVAQSLSSPSPLGGEVPLASRSAVSPPEAIDAPPAPIITLYPRDESGALVIPHSAYTFEGFRQWATAEEFPEHGKITFVKGELIVDMSPESFEEHGAVKTEIARVLLQLIHERKLGHYRIDRTLVLNKDAGLANEPDALFLSRETIRSGRAGFVPEVGRSQSSKAITGAVDWVLEVVSPSSRRKDKTLLRDAYFKAGIPEYWIVDVLGDEIDFQVLVPGDEGYQTVAPENGWYSSPTFKESFRLVREKDEDAYWQYTLEMK